MTAITAVIPSYNRAHLLERAAASVWSQTRPPVELVIVDDGSTDDTAEVVRTLDGRNRYIHKENGGGASARNRGVEEATTDWVAFLDSDDLWTSDHLANLAAAIDATGGAADLDRAAFVAYLADLAAGTTEVNIDRVFTLDDIAEAHRYMESNQAMGKLVVEP